MYLSIQASVVCTVIIIADGVEQEQPIRHHDPLHGREISRIVLGAYVLEHANGDGFVEAAAKVPVVHQLDADQQTSTTRLGKALLFLRDRDAGYFHSVALSREFGQPAPTAADVQQPLAGFQSQLVTDGAKLGKLGPFQIFGILPITTAVAHGRIQHGRIDIVADVVMMLTDLESAFAGLTVEEDVAQEQPKEPELAEALYLVVEAGP